MSGIDPGWRDWPIERLEREYSPSSCVASIDPFLQRYRELSEAAYRAHPHRTLAYGSAAEETVDVFPAGAGSPMLVFIHGGYWQELSKRESTFGAGPALRRGITWAAVDYTLAPRTGVAGIVEQCRRAVRRLCAEARGLGCDPARIWLAGSSAGAHLAAMAIADPDAAPVGRPAGAVLLSGIYDLRPLVPTYVNRPLALDDAQAWALSPLAQPPGPALPTLVAWGEHETASFVAQSRAYAARLDGPVHTLEVPARNHFDVVFDLLEPGTPLGDVVLSGIGRGDFR